MTILGANGAGKTTILKTVSGVMDPQKGSVTLEGRAIHGLRPDGVARRGLSRVAAGREVCPFRSVRENLRMGAYARRDTRSQLERALKRGDLQGPNGFWPTGRRYLRALRAFLVKTGYA